ncbi:MAG: hypothetical protein FWG83_07800 [Oscillospiraceae bacterium]|nr:hypothetical protein [Oscillospiraceae bacterium]
MPNNTFDRKPFERKPFERKPFERKQFERKPFERKPFERKPLERGSFERKPFERKPFERKPLFSESLSEEKTFEREPFDKKSIEGKQGVYRPKSSYAVKKKKNEELTNEVREIVKDVVISGVSSLLGNILTQAIPQPVQVVTAVPAAAPAVAPEVAPVEEAIVSAVSQDEPAEELLSLISGYVYLTLKDLDYPGKSVRSIMQKLEEKVSSVSRGKAVDAYGKSEDELFPIIVAGIVVPPEFHDIKIDDLKFVNPKMATRVKNTMTKARVRFIRDFRDKKVDLDDIRNFGGGTLEELKAALRNTIGEGSAAVAPIASAVKEVKEKIEKPEKAEKVVAEKADTTKKTKKTTPPAKKSKNKFEIPANLLDRKIESLVYKNSISRTKMVKKLKNFGVEYVRDLNKEDVPSLTAIFSAKGKLSFLEVLKNSSKSKAAK